MQLKNQRDIEILIGQALRAGVMAALAITLFGGAIYLFQHQGVMPNYKAIIGHENAFAGAKDYLREIGTIVPRMFRFDGAAIVQFGVIVLIATPIIRVALSLISFAKEKDRFYVVITAIVLLVILGNMLLF